LLKYVDSVESRVQGILQAHEGEFLEAYHHHVKKVREEMETLRRQSSHNANSEQVHLERIAQLEKQLALFREESLKLFQKVVAREKEVAELNVRLREAQAESMQSRKSLQAVGRRNKDLEAALIKIQQRSDNGDATNQVSAREDIQSL
jgi:chromosome segregation ATPase